MKRWRCEGCYRPGNEAETEWEDHLTQSFCRACGKPAVRVYEFGCFACDDAGRIFWGTDAPSHPCPDCNSPAYRIVHAPYVATNAKHADFVAADKMLERALEQQGISSTTLKPPPATPVDPRFAGGWVNPSQVMGRAMPGSQSMPLGQVPRPVTQVVGSFDRKD